MTACCSACRTWWPAVGGASGPPQSVQPGCVTAARPTLMCRRSSWSRAELGGSAWRPRYAVAFVEGGRPASGGRARSAAAGWGLPSATAAGAFVVELPHKLIQLGP
eukprot:13410717-Heterocapsa_arctica.AAC.1